MLRKSRFKQLSIVVAIIALLMIFAACTPFASDAPLGISEDTRTFTKIKDARMVAEAEDYKGYIFKTEKQTMCYRLKSPKEIKENIKYPLIVFLHGSIDGGTDNSKHMFRSLIDNVKLNVGDDCYVFMPQGNAKSDWTNYVDKKGKMKGMSEIYNACLDTLIEDMSIDKNRVYITGMSMGGGGTGFQISNFPQKYAAAMPLCGYFPEYIVSDISVLKNFPIWLGHSVKDPVVNFSESKGFYDRLVEIGNNDVHNTWLEGNAHDMTKPFYDNAEVWKWLMSKSR